MFFINCSVDIKDIHHTDQCYDFIFTIREQQEGCEKYIVHGHVTMNVQLCHSE